LLTVPKGDAWSYGELAQAMGEPSATRAVASACGRNKVGVVVPCHRIVRSDGSLGGYRWGLPTKQTLLDQERAIFRASLERHGQLQEEPGELKPGVTHVVEAVNGELMLQRKRFSSI
jgi:O-6-methylguanine DNA methyltransferase